ncbi:hypothetical protein B296_00053799 [Ensete ventricosum]|uniref:Uncharacterized protein n=1 Tax=Ensete ventricosum TaxID=4639 RepID=A0A426XP14_ENSVE|nr:hypothetical protein B296_00053799 [Ensete ventricosum]
MIRLSISAATHSPPLLQPQPWATHNCIAAAASLSCPASSSTANSILYPSVATFLLYRCLVLLSSLSSSNRSLALLNRRRCPLPAKPQRYHLPPLSLPHNRITSLGIEQSLTHIPLDDLLQ